jgi:hypothetical protein
MHTSTLLSVGYQSGWVDLPLPALACSVSSLRSFGKFSRSILVEGWPSITWYGLCLHSRFSCSLNLHTVADSNRVFFYLYGLQKNDLATVCLECGHLVIRVQHSMVHHPESEGFSGGTHNWNSSSDKPSPRSSRMLHPPPASLGHRIGWHNLTHTVYPSGLGTVTVPILRTQSWGQRWHLH